MRFIADGVDIPDELLWWQDEGRVVFFCGAGVSRAKADLPDFNGLTQRVLDGLGATEQDDARRLFEFAKTAKKERGVGIAISDQVFHLLRRSFTDADIEAKVAECLKKEDVNLDAHRTLLNLARLQSGETRIVTTNFDRLFEQCNSHLRTVTRSNLPHLAFNEADWGIVHLHGCVKPDYTGPTRDGFVLSSAEFGDAYLAMGWARDFVREILDRYVAVFIGYSADDPPIRYLLEGLQLSKRLNNRAYAFQSDSDDGAAVSWDEKGVKALIYPVEEGCGHRRLWETLNEWAKRTANPVKWKARALKRAQKGPSKLAPHERGIIAHVVSSTSGAQAFWQRRPLMVAEWLCVFDPLIRFGEPRPKDGRYDSPIVDPHAQYCLDSDPPPRIKSQKHGLHERLPENVWSAFSPTAADLKELSSNEISNVKGPFARTTPFLPRRTRMLASWIAAVADQPAAAWWAGQQVSLHHDILDHIHLDVEPGASVSRKAVADAWHAIAEYHDLQDTNQNRAYTLRLKTERASWRQPLAREYAALFSPRLKLGGLSRRPVPPASGSLLKVIDLVHIRVEYSEVIRTIKIPDEYLHLLLPKLRAALELAEDLENRYSYNVDFCSIEPDERREQDDDGGDSYNRQYKLSGHVLLFVDLFKRLANQDPKAARTELATWQRHSKIFDRLRIWALGNLDIIPSDNFATELLALPDDGFWPFRGERDLLLGLARKWPEFGLDARKALEKRILKGPPRYKRLGERSSAERSAHHRLSRLNWLRSRGCEFTFDLNTINVRLRTLAPEWKPEFAESAAESHDGRSGWVRTEADFSAIENLPAHDVVPYVESLERRPDRHFVSFDPFLGLSKERPAKALAALIASNGRLPFAQRFWETFLRVDVRKEDIPELFKAVTRELLKIPDEDFILIARSASTWFKMIGLSLLAEAKDLFDALWNKFIRTMRTNSAASESSLVRQDSAPDWAMEAINSASGDLAELAVSIHLEPPRGRGEGFPQDWLIRLEQLLALPGDLRRYALVIAGYQMNWLFHIDPDWTQSNIVGVLEGGDSEPDQDAIWAGIFWNATVPHHELYVRIKPHLLRKCRQHSEQQARYEENQAGMVLAGWGTKEKDSGERLVPNAEMRALILDASNGFRQHIIWLLDRWCRDDEGNWSSQIIEFLRDAWPKQKYIRTAQTSARLCELALSQKFNFSEIAELVSQLVTKVADDNLFLPELRNADETLAGQFPESLLGLLYAILPDNAMRWPYGAEAAVRTLGELHPAIRADARYIELEGRLQ